MQAVAVQGAHKHYQLQQADLTCSSLDELTVYNIRRLFALKASMGSAYAVVSALLMTRCCCRALVVSHDSDADCT